MVGILTHEITYAATQLLEHDNDVHNSKCITVKLSIYRLSDQTEPTQIQRTVSSRTLHSKQKLFLFTQIKIKEIKRLASENIVNYEKVTNIL